MPKQEPTRRLTHGPTHDSVLQLIERDLQGRPADKLRAIDLPCGAGALAQRLHALGLETHCCDIDPGNFEAKELPFTQANLNHPITAFPANHFDIVVSVAGLQRLYAPEMAIREFLRITKPGGKLYLSVPNMGSLQFRLRYFLYGSLGTRIDRPTFIQTTDDPQMHVRFPITYTHIDTLLRSAGFRILETKAFPEDHRPYTFFPVSMLIKAASQLKAKKSNSYRTTSRLDMLASKAFAIVATKET